MAKKLILFLFLAAILLFLIFLLARGCDKPPTEELSQAEKTVDQAKQKEAHLYAQDNFNKAEDALRRVKEFMAEKKYAEAKKEATEAIPLAQKAISEAEQNRAKLRAEAERMLSEVEKLLDHVKDLFAKSIPKMGPQEKKALQETVSQWEKKITDIKKMIQEGKIHEALDQLKRLKAEIQDKIKKYTVTPEQKTGIK